jgi:hypothetical protein
MYDLHRAWPILWFNLHICAHYCHEYPCLPLLLLLLSSLQESIEVLRARLGGKLESAVLNCCAFTTSAAAQQLVESCLVKRGHR